MTYVRYEPLDNIAYLTIDRTKALNALNSEVLRDISDALSLVDLKTIRCLIIRGAGEKAFVAGADIAQMEPLDREEGEEFGRFGNEVMHKICNFPIPVIAAVGGYALGGGCELAMACDFRICSDNAVFGQPEVTLGITPGFGGTQRLARLVGRGMAKQMIYTGKSINAQEAYRIGLVNAIYPREDLYAEAEKIARQIASNAPIAVREAKRAINQGVQVDIRQALEIEERNFGYCFGTADQQKGMEAFLEKRKHDPFENK